VSITDFSNSFFLLPSFYGVSDFFSVSGFSRGESHLTTRGALIQVPSAFVGE
jgi:hypothetical protein